MKNTILTGLLFSFLFLSGYGQTDDRPEVGPALYFNSFQDYKDKDADSALYFVKLLAENPKYIILLQDLLHNSFAQTFQKMWEREYTDSIDKVRLKERTELGNHILKKMMLDSNQNLVNCARPIYYWTQIQQNENNPKKLIELTNKFITSHLSANDIYQNKVGRYALLIYQIISQKKELNYLANRLYASTKNKLRLNQVIVNVDTASRQTLAKRTWYRYLYAYCNYLEATKLLNRGKKEESGNYFKIAFDYSPDLTDKNNASAFFYEMYFLLEKEKRSFQEEYLEYLTNYCSDKNKTLSTLLTIALASPAYKDKLKEYYNINFPNREPFANFWLQSINKNLQVAPAFSLTKIDGTKFSTANKKGQWILIDFWGTWCAPCREEHPDLQKFYEQISIKDTGKLSIITIACGDIESKVVDYLAKFKYGFPVAMADNSIETVYNVRGYPSKILITPQGKYLTVPFGIDWVDFIKKYADL